MKVLLFFARNMLILSSLLLASTSSNVCNSFENIVDYRECIDIANNFKNLIVELNPNSSVGALICKDLNLKKKDGEAGLKKQGKGVNLKKQGSDTDKKLATILERLKKYVKERENQNISCCESGSGCCELPVCNIDGLNFEIKFMTNNDCYSDEIKNEKLGIKNFEKTRSGVMIHSTASPGKMAKDWFDSWNLSYKAGQAEREVCVHMFVDNKSAYLYLPLNLRSWHCGGEGNNRYISVEMCEPGGISYSTDKSQVLDSFNAEDHRKYFNDTYKNTVIVCASLLRFLNTSVNKLTVVNNDVSDTQAELTPADKYNVISHKEGSQSSIASAHNDPDHIWKFLGYNMDQFRKDVQSYLESGKALIKFGSNAIINIDKSPTDSSADSYEMKI